MNFIVTVQFLQVSFKYQIRTNLRVVATYKSISDVIITDKYEVKINLVIFSMSCMEKFPRM